MALCYCRSARRLSLLCYIILCRYICFSDLFFIIHLDVWWTFSTHSCLSYWHADLFVVEFIGIAFQMHCILKCTDKRKRVLNSLSSFKQRWIQINKPDFFLSVLSETTDSTEEEWQSIADLATACRSILEALSREGEELFLYVHLFHKHFSFPTIFIFPQS